MRRVALVLLLVLAAGCTALLQTPGPHPQIGVVYQLTLYCSLPVRIGDGYWDIDLQGNDWPAKSWGPTSSIPTQSRA